VSLDERFEQLIAFLGSQLPAPVEQRAEDDGSLMFLGGAPPEVVVYLTSTKVTVSEFAGVWQSPGHLIMQPRRVGTLVWARLPETPLINALSAMIKGARDMRLRRYQACASCGAKHPPEVLFSDGVCPACAEPQNYRVH
jgi:hypothetical protein